MSSILAAMRQQKERYQSPSPIQQQPTNSPAAARSLLTGFVVAVLGVAVGVAGFYTFGPDTQGGLATNAKADNLVLGAPQQLSLISLPEPKQPAVAPLPANASTSQQGGSRETRALQAETSQQPAREPDAEALDLDSVSPELLAAFEDALVATADSSGQTQEPSVLPLLTELPARFQAQVPYFSYDAHNYVSDVDRRFLILGGRRLYEGDYFDDLQVIRIEPQYTVLAINRQAFRQTALEDWTGSR
ncbi:MAG: general secretion pathway protein GspB [Idiomarina sp.]